MPAPTHGSGRSARRRAIALRPLDDTCDAHFENYRYGTNRLARHNPRNDTLAKIKRIGFRHICRPPPSRQLESELKPFGNLEASVRSAAQRCVRTVAELIRLADLKP